MFLHRYGLSFDIASNEAIAIRVYLVREKYVMNFIVMA